jgi:hypothetical protein
MRKFIIFVFIISLIISCDLINDTQVEITTIDSTNFYQVFDTTKYKENFPSNCFDLNFDVENKNFTRVFIKVSNLDSSTMNNLSFKLFITYPYQIKTIMMNSTDSLIIVIYHKDCLSGFYIIENLVNNGAKILKK